MDHVIDGCVALSWCFPDEFSDRGERFLKGLGPEDSLWIPPLWWYEVANALVMGERRGRIRESEITEFLELIGKLPLRVDLAPSADSAWRLRALAQEYRLSGYDAAYLELAQRQGLALATGDKRLAEAAKKAGVSVNLL